MRLEVTYLLVLIPIDMLVNLKSNQYNTTKFIIYIVHLAWLRKWMRNFIGNPNESFHRKHDVQWMDWWNSNKNSFISFNSKRRFYFNWVCVLHLLFYCVPNHAKMQIYWAYFIEMDSSWPRFLLGRDSEKCCLLEQSNGIEK